MSSASPLPAFQCPSSTEATPSQHLESSAAGGWRVREKVDVASGALRLLKEASKRVQADVLTFADPPTFGLVHSALCSFAQLGPDVQQSTCDLATTAVQQAIKRCNRALDPRASDAELADCRALLMASVYFLCWAAQEAEKLHASAAQAASGVGSKKAAWYGPSQRENVVLRLYQALELDLNALWSPRTPDKAFVLLFQRAAHTILEQPDALKGSSASLRDALWGLVALPATRHEQGALAVSALKNLLLERERVAPYLAELCHHLETEPSLGDGAVLVVAELLRDLAGLATSQLSADSAGSKNVGEFLVHLAADGGCPLLLLLNLEEMVLPHLNADNETLRSGAVSACGQLLIHTARSQEQEVAEASVGLFGVILERLRDTSYRVRSRALQTLCLLCSSKRTDSEEHDEASVADEGVLSIDAFFEVMTRGLAHLIDKTSTVRKAALQLFCTVLEQNPLVLTVNRGQLIESRDALRAQVASTLVPAPEEESVETKGVETEGVETKGLQTEGVGTEGVETEGTGGEAGEQVDASDEVPAVAAQAPQSREARELERVERMLQLEQLLQSHMPDVILLLGSQTDSDVIEAVKAIVTAHRSDLQDARPARILPLVFSDQPKVKEAALEAAQSTYLHCATSRRGMAEQATETASGLLELLRGASLAEITSLEKVVAEWQARGLIPECLFTTLWNIMQGKHREFRSASDRCGALAVLNMAGAQDGQLLGCKIALLIQQIEVQETMLKQAGDLDLVFVRHLCVALQRSALSSANSRDSSTAAHAVVTFLVHEPPAEQLDAWFATAQQALEVIFAFSPAPEQLCSCVLRHLGAAVAKADQETGVSRPVLLRLLFCLGHVGIKALAHIEACEKLLKKGPVAGGEVEEQTSKGRRSKKASASSSLAAESISKELGSDAAAAEEESQYLLSLGDKLLEPDALLGSWAPLVEAACTDPVRFDADLRSTAILTLCKLMCVSETFCKDKLKLLFTIMRDEPDNAIRSNVAVALGDLALMHHNLLDHWKPHLYKQLRDGGSCVRKNMLMVLTHLILNDNIRPMGQLSEIARRLLDVDSRIIELARLFFSEYAEKTTSPTFYNQLPGIISALSRDSSDVAEETLEGDQSGADAIDLVETLRSEPSETAAMVGTEQTAGADSVSRLHAPLQPEEFREVLKILISFIKKGKADDMVGKICAKFNDSDKVGLHRNLAFCVCALPHTATSVRKLLDHFKLYGNRLGDPEVFGFFIDLVARMRKPGSFAQADLRPALDELEQLLQGSQRNAQEEEGAEEAGDAAADENIPPRDNAATRGEASGALDDATGSHGGGGNRTNKRATAARGRRGAARA